MSRAKHKNKARQLKPPRPPVRPDLATVEPMYYPIVEQQRHGSMAEAAQAVGLPPAELAKYQAAASINVSDFVVIDRMVLGDPANKVCLALVSVNAGAAVAVCAAFFAELTGDKSAAEAIAAELADKLGPIGQGVERFAGVGEFRPNAQGPKQ